MVVSSSVQAALAPVEHQSDVRDLLCFITYRFKCIDLAPFEQRLASIWNASPKNPVEQDLVPWLSLYYAILCTSLHLIDLQLLAPAGYTEIDRKRLTAAWSASMGECWIKSDMAQTQKIEHIQSYM